MGHEYYFDAKKEAKKAAKKADRRLKEQQARAIGKERGVGMLQNWLGSGKSTDEDWAQDLHRKWRWRGDNKIANLKRQGYRQAVSRYTSPQGQEMDRFMGEAIGLRDREGEEYQQYYEALTSDAKMAIDASKVQGERAIAAEQRGVERGIRATGSRRGAARNTFEEQQLIARSGERTSASRADLYLQAGVAEAGVESEASRFLEDYRNKFFMDAVSFADQWAKGTANFRLEFQQGLNQLASARAQVMSNMGAQLAQLGSSMLSYQASRKSAKAAEGNFWQDLAIGVVTGGAQAGAAYAGSQAGN